MAKTETSHAASYYAATANPRRDWPALQGDHACDVCIVGGGYSGLSTALHLAERGLKIILLEAVKIGFGASGRNGGQVINGYSRDHDTILGRYGADTANALLAASFEGGDIIREKIAKYKINCDYKPGSFFAAFSEGQMKTLLHNKEVWESAGNREVEIYTKDRMKEVVGTDIYYGGMVDRRGGHLHPLNLALGEAAALDSLGGKIFEQSRVTSIEDGAKQTVHTSGGKVTASHVVICGNAYLDGLMPSLSGKTMSVSSQIITTEPLGEELAKKTIPSGFCVEDCNFLLDYYRITADHRLLFGGGVVYSSTEPSDIIKRLHPHLIKTFPYLADKKIDFAWSGKFTLTLTRMPHIGRLSDKVYFIQGDNGHGVTTCHLLGKLTAEAICQQSSRYDVFASMRNFPFPGGRMFRVPLTALGAWYYGMREKLGI